MEKKVKQDYLDKLNNLVNSMNRKKLSSDEIQEMLKLIATEGYWECPCYEEYLLLEDLIERAKDYIELEKKLNSLEYNYAPEEEKERWNGLRHYFTDLQIGLRDNKSILCDLSL